MRNYDIWYCVPEKMEVPAQQKTVNLPFFFFTILLYLDVMRPTHTGKSKSLLSLLIQISSRSTLIGTPRMLGFFLPQKSYLSFLRYQLSKLSVI
jgi:hypothetical protein